MHERESDPMRKQGFLTSDSDGCRRSHPISTENHWQETRQEPILENLGNLYSIMG